VPFRPQRAFGQWLLRALGAIDARSGRQITALEWEPTVLPIVDVGVNLPGQTSIPKREVWSFSEPFAAVIGNFARIIIYSSAATFSTRDPRTASGCFVLNWRTSHAVGVLANPPIMRMGVPVSAIVPPTPTALGRLTPLWGIDIATAAVTIDLANKRSPRVQCLAETSAAGTPGLAAYPALLGNDRGTYYDGPPIYVPPGQAFILEGNTLDLNFGQAYEVEFVEAEEVPVEIPLR